VFRFDQWPAVANALTLVAALGGAVGGCAARSMLNPTQNTGCPKPMAGTLLGDSLENVYPAWSPDGQSIAFTSLRRGNFDIYLLRLAGRQLTRLTDDPAIDAHPAWSPDGLWISFDSQREGNREGYFMTAGGCAEQNLTRHPAGDGPLSWAPTGSAVAFNSDRSGVDQIYRGDLRRTAESSWTLAGVQAITTEGRNQAPSWAPLTAKILFESRRDGNREVYVMQDDGSEQRNLTQHPAPDFLAKWSPNGAWITFWSLRAGNEDIYVMRSDGRELTRLTTHAARDRMPAWAPDGEQIVFSSDRTGVFELFLMRRDGSMPQQLTCGAGVCPPLR
jgi:TolB protein